MIALLSALAHPFPPLQPAGIEVIRRCPSAVWPGSPPSAAGLAPGRALADVASVGYHLLAGLASLLALVILAFAASLPLSHPGRVALKTVLAVPELFPGSPVRPLLWVTPPPRHEEHTLESLAGQIDFDLYLPTSTGTHGAVILYTGAFGLRSDPAFVQVAEALARSGAVVMVPESAALRAGEIRPTEVDGLRQALTFLHERPEVDRDRIGIVGFSAGGSIVLLAAEDDVARDQIAFVNIFGAYFDAEELLLAVASHEIDVDGATRAWHPHEVTVYTFMKQVILSLPDPADRDILARAFLERRPEALAELGDLSPDGQLLRELFERPSRERAGAILEKLPGSSREYLAAISPSRRIDRLRARLYLMHGRQDGHIPVTHARELAAATRPGSLRRYSELDLFVHVMPNRDISTPTLVFELFKLGHHVWLVGQEYL